MSEQSDTPKTDALVNPFVKGIRLTRPTENAVLDLCRSLERELSEVTRERQRERVSRYGRIRASGSDHTTACSIWGDDGQGNTKENYPQPLPCNCGALENFYREKAVAAERERDGLQGKLEIAGKLLQDHFGPTWTLDEYIRCDVAALAVRTLPTTELPTNES